MIPTTHQLLGLPKPRALLLTSFEPLHLVDTLFTKMQTLRRTRALERARLLKEVTAICKNLNQLGFAVILERRGHLAGASLRYPKGQTKPPETAFAPTPTAFERKVRSRIEDLRSDLIKRSDFKRRAALVGLEEVEHLLLARLHELRASPSQLKPHHSDAYDQAKPSPEGTMTSHSATHFDIKEGDKCE